MAVSTKVRRLGSCNGATSTTRHPSNVSRVCRLCACCAVSSYFDLFAVFTVITTHSDWRSENYSRFASSMVPLILPNSTNRGLGTEGCGKSIFERACSKRIWSYRDAVVLVPEDRQRLLAGSVSLHWGTLSAGHSRTWSFLPAVKLKAPVHCADT